MDGVRSRLDQLPSVLQLAKISGVGWDIRLGSNLFILF